jgi:HPt (histidine-containing phosphotransfer) domain-containing protein
MDVQMPEMDGFEATRRIRHSEVPVLNPFVPIIAMTAHAMRGDREKCLAAGMDDYLSKPIEMESLAAMLKKWLIDLGQTEVSDEIPTPAPPQAGATKRNPVFDPKAFLACVANDLPLAHSILESFCKDVDNRLQLALDCLKKQDQAGSQLQAHSIKGAAATVCANDLSQAASELEKTLKEGNLNAAPPLLEEVKKQFTRFLEELAAHPLKEDIRTIPHHPK